VSYPNLSAPSARTSAARVGCRSATSARPATTDRYCTTRSGRRGDYTFTTATSPSAIYRHRAIRGGRIPRERLSKLARSTCRFSRAGALGLADRRSDMAVLDHCSVEVLDQPAQRQRQTHPTAGPRHGPARSATPSATAAPARPTGTTLVMKLGNRTTKLRDPGFIPRHAGVWYRCTRNKRWPTIDECAELDRTLELTAVCSRRRAPRARRSRRRTAMRRREDIRDRGASSFGAELHHECRSRRPSRSPPSPTV